MSDIDFDRLQPLRLAVGSHQKGSGFGCAMNVVSYITGDVEITDYPTCANSNLSYLVQQTNDILGTVRGKNLPSWTSAGLITLLTPEDALLVVDLGTLTIGTASADVTLESLGELAARAGLYPLYLPGTPLDEIHFNMVRQLAGSLTAFYASGGIFEGQYAEAATKVLFAAVDKVRQYLIDFRDVHGLPAAPEMDREALEKQLVAR